MQSLIGGASSFALMLSLCLPVTTDHNFSPSITPTPAVQSLHSLLVRAEVYRLYLALQLDDDSVAITHAGENFGNRLLTA